MIDGKFSLPESADEIAHNHKQNRNQAVEKKLPVILKSFDILPRSSSLDSVHEKETIRKYDHQRQNKHQIVEGNETWQKFDAENENKEDLFDYEEGEADHDEIPNNIIADEIFDDPRGPGFHVAVEQQAKHIQNIENPSCNSFWKVFVILLLVCATVLATVLLSKQNSPDTKMENKVQKGLSPPNNDVDQSFEDADGTPTGDEKIEAEAKQTDYNPKETIAGKSRKMSRYFKALRNLANQLFKLKYFLIVGVFLVLMYSFDFRQSFERIPVKQTIQTALNYETQNELGKPAIQSLSSIPKMFFGKTCPRPSVDFIETFESRTMKKTIQTAFNSFRTCAQSEQPSQKFFSWAISVFSTFCIAVFICSLAFSTGWRFINLQCIQSIRKLQKHFDWQ